jgi:rod shape-determining protein MreD
VGVLIAAVGAFVAAIVESSVMTQLAIAGVKPDLVFSIAIAVALIQGFEKGMVWAVVGGLTLDMLVPARPVGATTLTLLVVCGLALIVGRLTTPRMFVVAITVFGLSFVYQAMLLALLALTMGVGVDTLSVPSLAVIAVLNTVIGVAAAWVVRALTLRFGGAERPEW